MKRFRIKLLKKNASPRSDHVANIRMFIGLQISIDVYSLYDY